MCILVMTCGQCQEYTECCYFHYFEEGELSATSLASPSHSSNMAGIQLWWLGRESSKPHAPLHGGEGSMFQGCVHVLGVKPSDSGGVNDFQVDELTPGWHSALWLDHTFMLV